MGSRDPPMDAPHPARLAQGAPMKLSEQIGLLHRQLSEQAKKIARLEQERRTLLRHLSDAHQELEQLRSGAERAS